MVGPVTRDLTLSVPVLPPANGSEAATESLAAAGGKGANPAVCAARLGARVRLVGAVGDDATAAQVIDQLRGDGIDVDHVTRARGASTGEIVHLVEPGGRRRYVESRGANARLQVTADLVRALCTRDTTVLVSTALPQPAVEAAVAGARAAGAWICGDLAGTAATAQAVLDHLDVARADATEAEMLTGEPVADFASAARAARILRAQGPATAAVQAGGDGDLIQTAEHEVRLPHAPVAVADPTGGGDAFTATLLVALRQGAGLEEAGRLASAAAAHTVVHLGGRPTFSARSDLAALV